MANVLKVEEWEVKIDYPERLSKQEKEKGWSREMRQLLHNLTEPFIFHQPQREFTLLYSNINATLLSAPSFCELNSKF